LEKKTRRHQAYLDLLKASYILYDIVLEEEASSALLSDEDRKSNIRRFGDIDGSILGKFLVYALD
jgi:hypothetical protein